MLADNLSMDHLRQSTLAKLEALANNTKVDDIKHAAHYIVMNVSCKTSRSALHELKKQLSKLLDRIPQCTDLMTFDEAYNQLMWVLPESLEVNEVPSELLAHSGILFSSSSLLNSDKNDDTDETSLLPGQENKPVKKPTGLFSKKWR